MNALRIRCGRDYEQPTAVPVLTDAYNLPAKKVIHIVGPVVEHGLTKELEEKLASAPFVRVFSDFKAHFGITDMYSGGFYPFPDEETRWAWWARHIYFNRYIDAPKPVYRELLELVRNKNYFVITTNVDHQFQRAGMLLRRITQTS